MQVEENTLALRCRLDWGARAICQVTFKST